MDNATRLKAIRHALGISLSDMSGLLGLSPGKGVDHIREMERGARDITGPVERLMRYMEQAVEIDEDAGMTDMFFRVLPRWLDCFDLEDYDAENQVEIVMHTRWPRFFALCVDDLDEPEQLVAAGVPVVRLPDHAGLGWMVVLFIDQPIGDPTRLIDEAAQLKVEQALRDLST